MLSTLNVSQTGLNGARTAVENVSNNIANENTAGYKKRVVQLSEIEQMDARFTGRGVDASQSYRVVSQYMYDRILEENSKLNFYDKTSSMLASVEAIFKETDESGLSKDLNRYFQALEDLRANPHSEVYETTLKNQGDVLIESLSNLYEGIEKQEVLEKKELYENVNNVNDILQQIGEINEKLANQLTPGNDLLDKRDMLEKELSKYADIEVDRTNGDYNLKISGVTAVRFNTNVRDVSVEEEHTSQIDRFVDSTGTNTNFTFADGFNNDDVVTFKLNNEHSVSVQFGESITMDWNGDGTATTDTVSASNYQRALVHKINSDEQMQDLVVAYNGNYSIDSATGNKVTDNTQDNFLVIESKETGTDSKFIGRVAIEEKTGTTVEARNSFYKDDTQSSEAESRAYVAIYEKEIPVKRGILKAQVQNLDSTNENNHFQQYKDKLDAFAQTLGDLTDSYIKTGIDEYVYGESSSDESLGEIQKLELFTGASVKTLKFNKNNVNDLTQQDLDYLSVLQWKKDISFEGKAQDPNSLQVSTFSDFFQDIKVDIASDKEGNDFLLGTQKEVSNSLTVTHDEIVKVDKDEEMVNLVKFQAAYTANAKVITTIDEMLKTLLGLKQ